MTERQLAEEAVPRVTSLKVKSVGTGAAIVQSAGLIAPAVGLTAANVFIAGLAGEAAPLTMVIGTLICLAFAKTIGDFARQLPSAGSFYTYLTKTFGIKSGFVTGVMLFLAYILLLPFQVSFVGNFIHSILLTSNIHIPWQVFALVLMVFSTVLAATGIQPALRVALVLLGIELAAFTILSILIVAHGGATGNSVQPFNPANSLKGSSGIFLSVVFTIFLFAGFESSTALGEEAKDPHRTIPRALLGTVGIIGAFFVFVTYAETIGFGLSAHGLKTFETDFIPFNTLANQYANGALSTLINLATISSFITVNVVTVNAVARVIFGMGRDRLLPAAFGRVNARQAPHLAAYVVGGWGVASSLIFGTIWGPENIAAWVAYVATLLFIGAYVMVMIGLPRYYYKHRRDQFNWVSTMIVPVVGLAGVLFVLYGTVHPFPAAPYSYFIWATIVLILAMTGLGWYLEQRNPRLVDEAGQLFATEELVERDAYEGQVATVPVPGPDQIAEDRAIRPDLS